MCSFQLGMRNGRTAGFTFFIITCFIISCSGTPSTAPKEQLPDWVNNLYHVFPSSDWLAVNAQGSSQQQAENTAMSSLARIFRTDVESLTQTSQQFSQIVNEAAGKRSISFVESQAFNQEVNTASNIKGLIGVQTSVHKAQNDTVYVNARMNRRECAARYSGMIRENTELINQLFALAATSPDDFSAYSALNLAVSIAEITDNFQSILEVLDSTAVNRKPSYGGANAIKTKMRETAGNIIVGISVNADDHSDVVLITRALGAFFTDKGFKIDEHGAGQYLLKANVRFESISLNDRIRSSRYYFDAAIEELNGSAVFSFTEDDRRNHFNESEAKRLAVRAVEASVKEGKFVHDFDSWLNTLID